MEFASNIRAIFLCKSDLNSYWPKTCTVYIFQDGFYSYK